jgi:hypothetical protein
LALSRVGLDALNSFVTIFIKAVRCIFVLVSQFFLCSVLPQMSLNFPLKQSDGFVITGNFQFISLNS